MANKDLKTTVIKWAKKIGKHVAYSRLVLREVSPSTTDKLIAGRYVSEPETWVRDVLLDEMAKDGFSLAGEKAS